jgi:fermentation-respiration switch protein FrsA (DUF1100 family)
VSVIWKLLLAGFLIYALLLAVLYFRQSALIYLPDLPGRTLTATPLDIDLAYEEVSLLTEDGIDLHGWFIPADEAKATLLFFHGNAGNISHRLDTIKLFNSLDLNVLIIDYRGYGQSRGKPDEAGTYRDAEAAWQYLTQTRRLDPGKVFVFGRSLGASIAAWLASRHCVPGLIVESGFSSVPSMASRIYPFLPVKWLSRFSYDTAGHVSTVQCPVLVIHSQRDEVVPFAEGLAIYDAAPRDKTFLEITGGHNDGFLVSGSTYTEGLMQFIDKNLQ